MVSVHAVHGGRRKPGGVAWRYRSRDLRPLERNLDVLPQAIGAADERSVRDWLGQDAFRVIGVSAAVLLERRRRCGLSYALIEPGLLQERQENAT